jgi:HEAT repeat protein
MRFALPLLCAVALLSAGCDNGRDRLLADLQSVRPEDRALAVKKLAQQAKPEDLILFTRAAKDQAAVVRSEAVVALGRSQDPRVVDLLGELLGDPDDAVQERAALALAEIKNDKAKAYLTMQYARRGRATRQAIVQGLRGANVPEPMAAVVAAEAKSLWERNVRALTEGTLPERVAAAEELGKSGRPDAVTQLLPLLTDSQVILAAAAVRGLGFAGDPRAVEPISKLLNENFPELREAACESLSRLNDVEALPKLRDVALERSAASSSATAAIIGLPRSPDADKALCDVALGTGPDEALPAGREMRRRGGCPLEPVLKKLAGAPRAAPAEGDDVDPSPAPATRNREPQVAGLQALAALGPTAKDALPKVLPLLASTDGVVRRMAFNAVGEMGDPAALDAVQKAYAKEVEMLAPKRQRWVPGDLPTEYQPGFDPAATALGDDPESHEALDRAKQSELMRRVSELNKQTLNARGKSATIAHAPREIVEDVSEEALQPLGAAIRTLGLLHAPGALETLQKHLEDSSPRVRRAAYEGLAALGPEGISSAADGLLESDRDVQSAVAQALADQGEPGQKAILEVLPKLSGDRLPLLAAIERAGPVAGAGAALVALLREGGPEAALAARLLGALDVPEAVDPLIKALGDPESVSRRDVLLALGRIGNPKASEAVSKELYSDSPDVRSAAAEALARVGSQAQAEALAALKGDYYRRVRESAQGALARVSASPGTGKAP